ADVGAAGKIRTDVDRRRLAEVQRIDQRVLADQLAIDVERHAVVAPGGGDALRLARRPVVDRNVHVALDADRIVDDEAQGVEVLHDRQCILPDVLVADLHQRVVGAVRARPLRLQLEGDRAGIALEVAAGRKAELRVVRELHVTAVAHQSLRLNVAAADLRIDGALEGNLQQLIRAAGVLRRLIDEIEGVALVGVRRRRIGFVRSRGARDGAGAGGQQRLFVGCLAAGQVGADEAAAASLALEQRAAPFSAGHQAGRLPVGRPAAPAAGLLLDSRGGARLRLLSGPTRAAVHADARWG